MLKERSFQSEVDIFFSGSSLEIHARPDLA